MNCPICRTDRFVKMEIEPKLTVDFCQGCRGKWISNDNYQEWLEYQGPRLLEIPELDIPELTAPEIEVARLCPVCRRILSKYKVGRELPFMIDRCGNCSGVWLEDKEWETLKNKNLHDELDRIFTDQWQEEVARESARNHLMSVYQQKFGAEDFKKIREFKAWMENHEKGDEIFAYIRDKNPFHS